MTWPFTPHTSFVDDSTPSINADFLNQLQEGVNAAAAAAYWAQPRCSHFCDDGTTISIYPTKAIVKDSSTSRYVAVDIPFSQIDVGDLVPSSASFAASSWFYVYATATDGVLGFEISATGPDQTTALVCKSGVSPVETHRYLGCFRTDNSGGATGAVVPYLCTRGRYTYDENLGSHSSLAATSWTSLSLTSADYSGLLVPPHVTHPILIISNNGAYTAQFRPTGTSYTTRARAVSGYAQGAVVEMRCSDSQSVDYKISSGGGDVSFSVGGFVEW